MPGSVCFNPITFDGSEKQQIEINFDEEFSYGINKNKFLVIIFIM